jgi:hypothetical protein
MSISRTFATDVSNDLPDETLRGIGDVIAIIMQILEAIGPILEDCELMQEETFGAGCCELASQIEKRAPGWRFKRARLRRIVKREQGLTWSEYREMGGDALLDSLASNAVKAGPDTVEAIHRESQCCCC